MKPEIREIWLSILGFEDHSVPKNATVCSGHFDPCDIITKAGIKYLKPGAIPTVPASVFQDDSSFRYLNHLIYK